MTIIADLLELFIKHGGDVDYHFVYCDAEAYLPLFKKVCVGDPVGVVGLAGLPVL